MSDAAADVKLNGQRHSFVAAYLADPRRNATKAAISAGYSEKTAYAQGSRLLKDAEITRAIAAWREEAKQRAITEVAYRIDRLGELEALCWDVVSARREEYADTGVVGGGTGIVVRQYKMVGGGENATMVEEHVVDTGLIKTIQALYDDVAKETGGRVDKVEHSGSITREFVIVADPVATGAEPVETTA